MSDAQQFLLTVDRSPKEAAEICIRVARSLESKDTKLVDVVQSLGEYLTDEDATLRAKAVAYYAGVLGSLDPKFLSRQQINVSVEFFCERIRDASGLKEAAQGLQALQRFQRFTGEAAVKATRALFTASSSLLQHPQGTRFVVLVLLDALLADQRSALKGMGEDFILGITELVSGEKDPRNLMIIFSMLKVVMVEWDITNHEEALFDAVFCYFPITFRPPPDDPYGITAQDLKARLRACIAATSHFAKYAFPALLDKLDSTSPNVKKDVLQTITACASSYDATTISTYTTQIWDSLKFEVLNPQEEDLAEEALVTAQAIARCLSPSSMTAAGAQTPLARFLRPITTECNKLLQEPQQKQAKPAGQMLAAVASASLGAFVFVVKAVVAPLLTVYQDAEGLGKQRALLHVLNLLFESAITLYGTWASHEARPTSGNPLDPFKDRLYELFTRALMGTAVEEASFRMVALKGLLRLATLRDYLANEEIEMVIHYLDEILLSTRSYDYDELRQGSTQVLLEISKMKPSLVMNITFPAFMAQLPDSDKDATQDYLSCLDALAKLSVEEHMFEILLRRLLNKLETVLANDSTPAYPRAILSALLYVLSQKQLGNDPNLETYFDKLVVGMSRRAAQPVRESSDLTALNDESVLHVMGKIANLVLRFSPDSIQQKTVEAIYTYFIPGFPSLDALQAARSEHKRIVILSTYFLAALRTEGVSINLESLYSQLVTWATQEMDAPTRTALLIQICLLTNKWLIPTRSSIIQDVAQQALDHLKHSAVPSELKETAHNSLRILFWLTKAVILAVDASSTHLLDHLLSLLAYPHYGLPTARGFSLLLAPHDLLTRDNSINSKRIHAQRVFYHCMPKLASDFRQATPATKPNYLIALAGLVKDVPTPAIMHHLDTFPPLLLQSMDLPDPDVKAASIETVRILLREYPDALESYISSLIPRLLLAAKFTSSSNQMKIRTTALQALHLFPSSFRSRERLLLPHRKKLIKDLLVTLDDPKRDVRREAVACRTAWLRLGDDDDDE